jgi:prophage regulatory protein
MPMARQWQERPKSMCRGRQRVPSRRPTPFSARPQESRSANDAHACTPILREYRRVRTPRRPRCERRRIPYCSCERPLPRLSRRARTPSPPSTRARPPAIAPCNRCSELVSSDTPDDPSPKKMEYWVVFTPIPGMTFGTDPSIISDTAESSPSEDGKSSSRKKGNVSMAACRTRISHSLAKPDLPRRSLPGEPALETPPVARTGRIRILRLGQVIQATGLGKTKIYELQATGDFPMRVQITSHSVGWVEEEIQYWLAHRIANRTSPRSATLQYAGINGKSSARS